MIFLSALLDVCELNHAIIGKILKKWVLNLKRLLNIALAGALIQLWKNK